MNENTYTYSNQQETQAPVPNDSGVQSKAVAWLGVTGSTLLMVSATIFVWSGWNDFPNAAKFGIIALITAMCFGTGQFLSKSLPVMGSIFTHLSIFLTPIVLLSGNMEAILPWRQFLLLEGIFCVLWFYGVSLVYKSPVLLPTSIASTALIALGLSSFEDTIFGSIPAPVYMVPVVISLALIPKLSKASLFLIAAVGFSPILTLIQPYINTGKGTIAGFGFVSETHWAYSILCACGLLFATVLAARTQKAMWILSFIPATVIPFMLMSLASTTLAVSDLYIIVPVVLLVIQSVILFAKFDSFFSSRIDSIVQGFNVLILVAQSYVTLALASSFFYHVLDTTDSGVGFMTQDQTIGLLLFLCVGIVALITDRNIGIEINLSIISFFSALGVIELTDFISRSGLETRSTIALVVTLLSCVAYRKHFLATVLLPVSLTSLYVGLSVYSTNAAIAIVGVTFVLANVYGLIVLDAKDKIVKYLAGVISSIWLLVYGFGAIDTLAETFVGDIGIYQVGFIFLVGLGLAYLFDVLGKNRFAVTLPGTNYRLRPSFALTVVAYLTTFTCGFFIDALAGAIFAGVVVLIALGGSIYRRESLALVLTAPTFVSGIWALGEYLEIDNSTRSLIMIGSSGIWLLISTYMKGNEIGCWVNGWVSANIGILLAVDSGESLGQAMFILGLIIIAIGIIRSVVALIPIGAVISSIGLWITLSAEGINSLTLYVAPVCIGLIALGMYNRNVFPSRNAKASESNQTNVSSWAAYSFPLVLFFTATLLDSIIVGEDYYTLIGGASALGAIAVGAWRKIIAPLVLGTVFLALFIIRQIFDVANAIPVWAWIGFGALVLISIAVTLEKSQLSPSQARRKVSAVISDHFE